MTHLAMGHQLLVLIIFENHQQAAEFGQNKIPMTSDDIFDMLHAQPPSKQQKKFTKSTLTAQSTSK